MLKYISILFLEESRPDRSNSDVMSLIVALYAIKVSVFVIGLVPLKNLHTSQLSAQSSTDSRYSYGWHRAEILAALVNGVFLLALCFSIFLEAIERFFNTAGSFTS
jgi:zinc transporter 1